MRRLRSGTADGGQEVLDRRAPHRPGGRTRMAMTGIVHAACLPEAPRPDDIQHYLEAGPGLAGI